MENQADRFHFETVADVFDGEILAIRKGYRLFHWNTGDAETEARPGEMLKRYSRSEQVVDASAGRLRPSAR
jgi:hypothetical protein